jgi:hypothetical protein
MNTFSQSSTGQLRFNKENVECFFKEMLRYQTKETMDKFCKYHTEQHIDKLMNLWPPPSDMCDIWNAWDRKGRPVSH